MKKKRWICAVLLLFCMVAGCAKSYEPEIIMPEQPVKSAVTEENTKTETDETQTEKTDEVSQETESETPSEDGDEKLSGNGSKIWLITMDQQDQYWLNIDKGCKKAAEEVGDVEYKWNSPDVNDDEKQKKCINDAVAEGVDAILVAANGPTNVNDALQNAKDAGIKIIFVDSAADFDCVQKLATDNEMAGRTAAEKMMEDFKEQNISSGKIGIVGVTKDTASCMAREKGFRDVFKETDFELLDTCYMQGDTKVGKKAIGEFIEQGCVGIFGANEGSTSTIGATVKEQKAKIEVVGFDTSDTVLGYINDGIISATMAQNPETMGYEGLKSAVKALNGKDIGEYSVDTGVSVITKDNM
ncbi:MAG: substrate-binding domain-containing protein [Lachnospiraceae bacterium]